MITVRDINKSALPRLVFLAALDEDAQSSAVKLELLDVEGNELRSAECPSEAEQDHGAITFIMGAAAKRPHQLEQVARKQGVSALLSVTVRARCRVRPFGS